MLNAPFFQTLSGSESLSADALKALGAAAKRQTNFSKAIAIANAGEWNLAQLRDLGDLFMSLDKDNDGTVDMQEALTGLAKTAEFGGVADLEQMVKNLVGPDGKIKYQEFVAGAERNRGGMGMYMYFCSQNVFDLDMSYIKRSNSEKLQKIQYFQKSVQMC